MDERIGESKSRAPLYCHFFHSDGSCRKSDLCSFVHGDKLEDCPNGTRCPIKVVHINDIVTPPQTKKIREVKEKLPLKEVTASKLSDKIKQAESHPPPTLIAEINPPKFDRSTTLVRT